MLYNDMIYDHRIDYIKYINNIIAEFFHFLLFYMKADTINIIIAGSTDQFTLSNIYIYYFNYPFTLDDSGLIL